MRRYDRYGHDPVTAPAAAAALGRHERAVLGLLADHRALTVGQLAVLCVRTVDDIGAIARNLSSDGFASLFGTDMVVISPWGTVVAAHLPGRAPLCRTKSAEDVELAAAMGRDHARLRTNALVTALADHAASDPDAQLVGWWSPECFRAWIDRETAHWTDRDLWLGDAYVVWQEGGHRFAFTLVTEPTGVASDDRAWWRVKCRVGRAVSGCHELSWVTARREWLLVACESVCSETAVRRLLAEYSTPVATTVLGDPAGPAGAVWWPIDGDRRLRLAELAQAPLRPAWFDGRGDDPDQRRDWGRLTASERAGGARPDLLDIEAPPGDIGMLANLPLPHEVLGRCADVDSAGQTTHGDDDSGGDCSGVREIDRCRGERVPPARLPGPGR